MRLVEMLVMAWHFVSSVILLVDKYKYELKNRKGIALVDSHHLSDDIGRSNWIKTELKTTLGKRRTY